MKPRKLPDKKKKKNMFCFDTDIMKYLLGLQVKTKAD